MNCTVCNTELIGKQTKFCSKKCKNKLHQAYPSQYKRGLDRKIKLIQLLGGVCSLCGYKKNAAALSFHHENEKSFKLDMRSLSNRKWETIELEAKNCTLLCANCHMELHYPHHDLT
jgi:predicted nucleic acid-binding Zn ribbon protein